MRKTALVIMAAGIGSRFGEGIKQLTGVGPNGEILMDYSIHDAIRAGFNKLIFVIRKNIEADFRAVIGERIERICQPLSVEVRYAYQELEDLPAGIVLPHARTKPWGTGQAVLVCRKIIKEPFAVINADDYYGQESFKKVHDYLTKLRDEESTHFCMAGFRLSNTLSANGGVTRGICQVDEDGGLKDIDETKNIVKTENGASSDGKTLDLDAVVSMNMWGLTPAIIPLLEEGFLEFFRNEADEINTAEYLLPVYISRLLHERRVQVKVLPTGDQWFGVTYQADRQCVVDSIRDLVLKKVYRNELFSDL